MGPTMARPPKPTSPGFLNVRFGSLADISEGFRDVRFTPKSGHAQRGIDVYYVPIADITEAAAGAGASSMASQSFAGCEMHQVVESWASNDCASKAQGERQGMKRAVPGLPVLPVKSPMHWL